MKLRVMLVEDQTMFLQLMAGMLRAHPRLKVVAAVPSITEGRKALLGTTPDLLVLDLSLPDGNGIDLLRSALEKNPNLQAIVVSGEGMNFVCPKDLRFCIRAVIDKTEAYDQLRMQIDEILRRTKLAAADRDATTVRRGMVEDPFNLLTTREKQIFDLIGRGHPTKAIADQLSISPYTVQVHRKAITKKIGKSGSDLVHFASIHQLINLDSSR
jgi:DNA-binding NarL/FixJ family response regulator